MRISDWSSDVCSSDLNAREAFHRAAGCAARDRQTPGPLPGDRLHIAGPAPADVRDRKGVGVALFSFLKPAPGRGTSVAPTTARRGRAGSGPALRPAGLSPPRRDRKSDVKGKSVSVRVNLGGTRV